MSQITDQHLTMSYQSYSLWSHSNTSKSIQVLIFMTAIVTVCSAALEPLFINVFKMHGPQEFFGLSWWGLANYYLWQPLTCLFVQTDTSGINLSFLLGLTFNMYILWLFGTNLIEAYGRGPFFRLYFLSGILGSLAALLVTSYSYKVIAGTTPCILAIFVAWAILHRDTQILLFFSYQSKQNGY